MPAVANTTTLLAFARLHTRRRVETEKRFERFSGPHPFREPIPAAPRTCHQGSLRNLCGGDDAALANLRHLEATRALHVRDVIDLHLAHAECAA